MRKNPAKRKLVYGVGLNDADYTLTRHVKEGGRKRIIWMCPYYRTWTSMLDRCYSDKFTARRPTYKDCSVCDEWLTFSNFKAWMETQDWEGKQLDKDILFSENKVYSPETCVFVDARVNSFWLNHGHSQGRPLDLHPCAANGKFQAKCRNPFTGECEYLGYHTSAKAAHEAWRRRKHELACQYADMQTDPRIAEALRSRIAVATHLTSNEPEEVCNA